MLKQAFCQLKRRWPKRLTDTARNRSVRVIIDYSGLGKSVGIRHSTEVSLGESLEIVGVTNVARAELHYRHGDGQRKPAFLIEGRGDWITGIGAGLSRTGISGGARGG